VIVVCDCSLHVLEYVGLSIYSVTDGIIAGLLLHSCQGNSYDIRFHVCTQFNDYS